MISCKSHYTVLCVVCCWMRLTSYYRHDVYCGAWQHLNLNVCQDAHSVRQHVNLYCQISYELASIDWMLLVYPPLKNHSHENYLMATTCSFSSVCYYIDILKCNVWDVWYKSIKDFSWCFHCYTDRYLVRVCVLWRRVSGLLAWRYIFCKYFNNVHCNQCSACEVLVHEICTSEAPKCTHER